MLLLEARTTLEAFGDWVRQQREAKGWSQRKASLKAGWSPQQWNFLEKRTSRPEKQTVEIIADTLGIPRNIAFRVAGYADELTYEPDSDVEEAMSYYQGMPPSLKPAAKAALKAMLDSAATKNEGKVYGKRAKEEEEIRDHSRENVICSCPIPHTQHTT